MLECALCGFVTGNRAYFEVSYGAVERFLLVCRGCREDLELLGLHINRVVRLEPVRVERLRFEPDQVDWRSVLGGLEELHLREGKTGLAW
jgi:hypothetical protein